METLNQNKKWIALVEITSAIILAVILFPVGIIYSLLIQPLIFYKEFKVFKYIKNFFAQIWHILMHLLHTIAFSIDLLGNVIVGELLELIITKQKDTWFGKREHSISQSIGFLEKYDFLNKRGIWLNRFLSIIFGQKHCINAFENYIKLNR